MAIAAGFFVALLVGVVTWIAWPTSTRNEAHETPTSVTSATDTTPSTLPTPMANPPVATTPTPTPATTPTMSATATASVKVKKPPPPVGTTKKPPVKNGPCDPPYFYKDGIKPFKPECL